MNNIANRYALVLMAFATLVTGVYAQDIAPQKGLPNLARVNSDLYRGGQPSKEGIAELKKLGIRTVIDLRDDDERSRKERGHVIGVGMQFVNIPMGNWSRPDYKTIASIMGEIAKRENQPVFVHCRRGSDRTGTVIAIYRIVHNGWTAEQALEEAKDRGIGWWQFQMKDYVKDFYRDYKAGKINDGSDHK